MVLCTWWQQMTRGPCFFVSHLSVCLCIADSLWWDCASSSLQICCLCVGPAAHGFPRPVYFARGGLCKPGCLCRRPLASISLLLVYRHPYSSSQGPVCSVLQCLSLSDIVQPPPAFSLASSPPLWLPPTHLPFSSQRDVSETQI